MTQSELAKSIRSGDIRACYFLWGKDFSSIERAKTKLVNTLIPEDERDLNYHSFFASDFSASEFYDASQSLPVFSERVVITVNDLNADSLRQDDTKLLFEAVSQLDSKTVTVIFYTSSADLCGGKRTISPKNKKLCEHISHCGGVVVEFAYKKPSELVPYIQSKLMSEGCGISAKNAEYLAEILGCRLLDIDNECAKLAAYSAGEQITENTIELLVSDQIETDAYKLSRAIVSGRRAEAFRILDKLYSAQEEPIPLLSVIAGSMMDLYRAKIALAERKGESCVIDDFDYKSRSFAVKNAFRDCRSIPIEKLRYSLAVLSDCDIDMKSKKVDSKVILETAITKILTYK